MDEIYKLLPTMCESIITEFVILESSRDNSGRLRVRGKFSECDKPNKNNRSYPRSVWEKAINDEEFKYNLSHKKMLMMLEHPSDGRTLTSKAAALVTKIELKDNGIIEGEYTTLNTPDGIVLKELIEIGVELGVSSRGEGDVKKSNGVDVVQDNYKCRTWDIVLDPSVYDALPKTVKESVDNLSQVEKSNKCNCGNNSSNSHCGECAKINGGKEMSGKNEVFDKLKADFDLLEAKYKEALDIIQNNNASKNITKDDNMNFSDKYNSALKIIRALKERVKDQRVNEAYKKKYNIVDAKYKESLNIIRALMEKYSKSKSTIKNLNSKLSESSSKDETISKLKLLAEGLKSKITTVDSEVKNYAESEKSKIPESKHVALSIILDKCTSKEDVDKVIESFMKLSKLNSNTPIPQLPVDKPKNNQNKMLESILERNNWK